MTGVLADMSTSAQSSSVSPEERQFLRHTLATLAYRGGKAVRGMPSEAAGFKAGEGSRSPAVSLAHIGDLLDSALSVPKGAQTWQKSQPFKWGKKMERFFRRGIALYAYLSSCEPRSMT